MGRRSLLLVVLGSAIIFIICLNTAVHHLEVFSCLQLLFYPDKSGECNSGVAIRLVTPHRQPNSTITRKFAKLPTPINHFLATPLAERFRCEYDDQILATEKKFFSSALCPKSWKVALAFRGKKLHRCNEYLDRFIWALPNVDIYVHIWSLPPDEQDLIQARYSPKIEMENISVVDSTIALFDHVEGAPRQASTHAPFLRGISQSLRLVAEEEDMMNFTYDLVVSLRWDLNLGHIGPISFPWLCPNNSKLYSQFGPELNWAFYDQWFYSSSYNMRRISGMYEALVQGQLYPRRGDNDSKFMKLVFEEGVPFSDKEDYWSNVVLSNVSGKKITPMTSVNPNADIRNIHLALKIFIHELGLFETDSAMYCTDRAYEDFWHRRQLPKHGFFPWSNSPPESSPNCVGEDSQFLKIS
jgi:hypothetical protein